MITRKAVVRELMRRTCGDGAVAFSAQVSFDESACTMVRLSAAERATLEAAMGLRRSLEMTLLIDARPVREATP